MNLFIKVINDETVDHPVMQGNLLDVFGEIPPEYQPFERTHPPTLGTFEVFDSIVPQYGIVNGVWSDLWPRRPMNSDELTLKNDELAEMARRGRSNLKNVALDIMSKVPEHMKQQFVDYIEKLEAHVIHNPAYINFPLPPLVKFDKDGNAIDTNFSGSAPNVIE